MFRLGSHRKASDYTKAFEELCNMVRAKCKQPEDFLIAFEKKEEIDWAARQPQLIMETAPTANASASQVAVYTTQQNANQSKYDHKYKEWDQRRKAYSYCNNYAYKECYDRCEDQLLHKIKNQANFEKEVKANAIQLMIAIHKYALNFDEKVNEIVPCLDSIVSALLTKQRDDESLDDYYTRFKSAWALMDTHCDNPIVLHRLTKKEYPTAADETSTVKTYSEANKKVDAKIQGFRFIQQSLEAKYGEFKKTLATDYTLGNDNYPSDLLTAKQMLQAHNWDKGWEETLRKKRERSSAQRGRSSGKSSSSDTSVTTETRTSLTDVPLEVSFNQMQNKCWVCGQSGHHSNTCKQKSKIPQEEWAMNKAINTKVQMAMATQPTHPALATISESESDTSSVTSLNTTKSAPAATQATQV